MNLPEGVRLDELAAEYQRLRDLALQTQERTRTVTATVTSAKNLLTVTVGPNGELQSLIFNSRSYRNMAPAELAHVILETVDRARAAVNRELTELMPAALPAGMSIGGVLNGEIDLSGLLPESLDLGGISFPSMPEAFRRKG